MDLSAEFIARIESVLGRSGVNKVTRAVWPGHAGIPRDASLMEQPRLMLCLEGRAVYELKGNDGATQVMLAPRDGLLSPRGDG